MKRLGWMFLGLGALCATAGMVWGIAMAISADYTMAPAHAHLNLVGWVTLALFGLYYAATPAAEASLLARVHFAFAALGALTLGPGIAVAVSGGGELLATIGSLLALLSMLTFLAVLLRYGLGREMDRSL